MHQSGQRCAALLAACLLGAVTVSGARAQTAPTDAARELRAITAAPRVQALIGPGMPQVLRRGATDDKADDPAGAARGDAAPREESVVVLNPATGRAALLRLATPSAGGEPQVLGAQRIDPLDLPVTRAEFEDAVTLAKRDPRVRQAIGDGIDRYVPLTREAPLDRQPFRVEMLRTRGGEGNDPCLRARCIALLFHGPDGYARQNIRVNVTARTVLIGRVS